MNVNSTLNNNTPEYYEQQTVASLKTLFEKGKKTESSNPSGKQSLNAAKVKVVKTAVHPIKPDDSEWVFVPRMNQEEKLSELKEKNLSNLNGPGEHEKDAKPSVIRVICQFAMEVLKGLGEAAAIAGSL